MSAFGHIERRVESTSLNKSQVRAFDLANESAIASQALRRIDRQEKLDKTNNDIARKNKQETINSRMANVTKHSILESQITNKINNVANDTKLNVFKDIVFETFSKALVLDESFVLEHSSELKALTDKFIDDEGGMKLLENTINNTNSHLLKMINNTCNDIANSAVKRIMLESKDVKEIDQLDFNMNTEEEEKLDYAKGQLDVEKISDLVKNKVLSVVKDEKENQAKHDEIVSEIENELSEDESVVDDDSIKEAMAKIVTNNTIVNESSLFNAMLHDAYEQILAENVAISAGIHHDPSTDIGGDISEYENISDDDDETTIDNLDGIDRTLMLENSSISVNMDDVMAEALTKYTLMETMYTLKLKDYSYNDIKKYTDSVSNRHITKEGPLMESVAKDVKKIPEKLSKKRDKFFDNLKNLKNKKNVDKSKKAIKELAEEDDPELKEVIENSIKIGIEQLNADLEKNPHLAESFTDYIKFLNDLLD